MRIFVFGATGATGVVLVPLARAGGHAVPFHVRPQSAGKSELARHADAQVFDISDAALLKAQISRADLVVSLIGTMRHRFGSGDTYESSDVGTTRSLVGACEASGVKRFYLLSSLGAGRAGAYLQMKGECERIVRESRLAWTLFRPSALVSPASASDAAGTSLHGARKEPPLLGTAMKLVGHIPGMRGLAEDVAPIGIDVLARAMLHAASRIPEYDGRILSGRDLLQMGG